MDFFNRQGRERTLSLMAAAVIGAGFAAVVFAQEYDSASVPFLVNVGATVSATDGAAQRQISVTAGQEAVLRLPVLKTTGIADGARRQINAPAAIRNIGGKVTVNLPAQPYSNAEVLLYTVNGKRILHSKVSAADNITHPNLATGVYLLSVRGLDGNVITTRLTHNGGGLNIGAAFGGEDVSTGKRLAKKAADGDWTITVSAAGYVDSVYTLHPIIGTNPPQNITLRSVSGGDDPYGFVSIGGKRWMTKNLNVSTDSSWCYKDSNSYCDKYGRLYTWEAAKTACQSIGWRLPDTADWRRLVAAAGGAEIAGKKFKSKNGWNDNGNGTDDFGFSALPGGYRLNSGGFNDAGNYGGWWTATESNDGYARYRYMYYYYDSADENNRQMSYGFSARCVQD